MARRCTTRRSTSPAAFAIYLYPPPFVLLAVPFALLPASIAPAAWIAAMLGAFLVGVALLPVRRDVRWAIVLLGGLSWPLAYSLKLGQVGPLLFLLFAAGWRWLDRPGRLGACDRPGHDRQGPAGDPARLGGAHPALAGDRRGPGRGPGRSPRRDPADRTGNLERLRRAAPAGECAGDHGPQLHARRHRLPARRAGGRGNGDPAGHHRRGPGGYRVGCAADAGRGRLPDGRHGQPTAVAPPLGPLRDAAPPAGCLAARTSPLVGGPDPLATATPIVLLGIVPAAIYPVLFGLGLVAPPFVAVRSPE